MQNTPTNGAEPHTRSSRFVADKCPVEVAWQQALIDNIPYALMLALGAWIIQISVATATWSWPAALLYVAYGIVGVLWIMYFMCPYCHFYDTRLCPCGYGKLAVKLRRRQAGSEFARQFRKHIPVIVPLWFIPLLVGAYGLWRQFTWLLLILLAAFAINSFVLLPLLARMYGCAECPQKENCPWMGGCKSRHEQTDAVPHES